MSAKRRATRLLALAALGAGLLAPSAQAAGPPSIEATWVEGVNATGATLWAEINPNELPTSYRFEYVGDAAYQQGGFAAATRVPSTGSVGVGAGAGAVKVSRHITALTPASAYHYRVWATNSAEALFGPEHILATEDPTNAFALPDGRGWELVSPVDKDGGAIQGPGANFGGNIDQAAAQGGLFTYSAATAFGQAQGAPPASQYLAIRTTAGWSSQNISTPLHAGAYGEEPEGVPYRLFSDDLSQGLLFGGSCFGEETGCAAVNPSLPGSGAPAGYANYYLRDSVTGGVSALIGAAAVAGLPETTFGASVAAASPDLSHVILSSCFALTVDATEVPEENGCNPTKPNVYTWSSSGLELVNVLPGDTEGTPGAKVAASLGAISGNGSRIYWAEGGNLYLREGGESVQVDDAQGGGGSFETASGDGSIAYFTKAGHLFRYLAQSDTATDLTPAGGVAGVLGASNDGSDVYYQDATGLWLWREGTTTELASGADATLPSDYPPATGTARVSPDGAHLAFLSAAELNGSDSAGLTEAYLYGPPRGGGPPILTCASCDPTGERPQGAASIPGAQPNGSLPTPYKPRALSADGQRLFFESSDGLVVQDTNPSPDVYQWEARGSGDCQRAPGCTSLISSGRSPGGATFLDASADGSDAFFLTDDSLIGADPGSIDVYDARTGGGFAEPPKPIPCLADACQALPGAPDDPTPGTLVPNGGNPALSIAKEKPKKKHHKKGKARKGKGRHRKAGKR